MHVGKVVGIGLHEVDFNIFIFLSLSSQAFDPHKHRTWMSSSKPEVMHLWYAL